MSKWQMISYTLLEYVDVKECGCCRRITTYSEVECEPIVIEDKAVFCPKHGV